jgi:hypothetical protein
MKIDLFHENKGDAVKIFMVFNHYNMGIRIGTYKNRFIRIYTLINGFNVGKFLIGKWKKI